MRTKTGDQPITLADLRGFLRIDHTDDDAQLSTFIAAGVDLVERETERDLIVSDVVELVESIHIAGTCVTLQRSPAIALTIITVDGVEIADGFTFRPNSHRRSRIVFDSLPAGNIEIRYTTGMPGDPTARQACLWAAAHLYSNREPEVVGASITQFETGLRRILKLLGAAGYA